MSKKVSYVDFEGFRQVGDLQEFEIDKFFTNEHPDAKSRRGYGFARLVGTPRGITRGIFLPAANRYYYMRPYDVKKREFIPEFTNLLAYRSGEDDIEPKPDVRIIGVVGEGRKGVEIVAWSTNVGAYEKALKSCEVYLEIE